MAHCVSPKCVKALVKDAASSAKREGRKIVNAVKDMNVIGTATRKIKEATEK